MDKQTASIVVGTIAAMAIGSYIVNRIQLNAHYKKIAKEQGITVAELKVKIKEGKAFLKKIETDAGRAECLAEMKKSF